MSSILARNLPSFPKTCSFGSKWVFRRYLRGSTSGDSATRWRNRRPSYYSSRVLLEKFVKLTRYDSSLVAKSPCDLKVRGCFFDVSNNVDRDKNRHVLNILRSRGEASPPPPSSSSPAQALGKDSIEEIEEAVLASSLSGNPPREEDRETAAAAAPPSGSKLKSMHEAIMSRLRKDLDSDFPEKPDEELRGSSANKRKKAASTSDDDSDAEEDKSPGQEIVPLHVLFYGRTHNRLDSYTIMNYKGQQQSHVYVTDASCVEEAQTMFQVVGSGMVGPVGSFSIWRPKGTGSEPLEASAKDLLPEDFVSGFKTYIPNHLLAQPDNSLKTVFLVPTMMSKIYLEGEGSADVELDASLIEDLESVGLCSESGSIKIKDLTSGEVRLASKFGNVVCDGALEGNVVAEMFGDGDFVARFVEGPAAMVTTESGDITIWGECKSERSHFFTRSGNVSIRDLYNQNYMNVKEDGNITTNIVEGSISAVVRKGDVHLGIDTLLDHSTIHVTEGNIVVTVPRNPSFRINATGNRTDIAPNLLNTGDMFLSEKGGYETFTNTGVAPKHMDDEKVPESGACGSKKVVSFHETEPTLNMITNKGTITINVQAKKEDSRAKIEEGFDSFT